MNNNQYAIIIGHPNKNQSFFNVFNRLTKVLDEGKGVSVRKGLKGWSEA